MILETRDEVFVVNYSVPCGYYWIGGSTNIILPEFLPPGSMAFFVYRDYIPNDSGIDKAKSIGCQKLYRYLYVY